MNNDKVWIVVFWTRITKKKKIFTHYNIADAIELAEALKTAGVYHELYWRYMDEWLKDDD